MLYNVCRSESQAELAQTFSNCHKIDIDTGIAVDTKRRARHTDRIDYGFIATSKLILDTELQQSLSYLKETEMHPQLQS